MKRRFFFLWLILSAAACAAGYLYFKPFDTMVQQRFQGRLWELPARVYARPLELYTGLALDPAGLENELSLLGYHRPETGRADQPGTYMHQGDRFLIYVRAFDYGDEKLADRKIQLRITSGIIQDLRQAEKVFDSDIERLDPVVIGSFYPDSKEDRILVTLKDLPDLLPKTLVAVEDRNFYSHHGVDPRSVIRAIAVDLKNRRLTQGASTLTQQLARNFFLDREKSLVRKVNEVLTAVAMELHYTKKEILEAYINEVYLGQDGRRAIHGFGLAAKFYFATSVQGLSPQQIALLVGMLKGPSAYDPRRHPEAAANRRNVVLKVMAGQGLISKKQLAACLAAPLGVVEKKAGGTSPFPCYLDLVKRRLMTEYREQDLKTMGLRIFTALDPQVQLAAEAGTQGFLKGRDPQLQAGVVVTTLATNEIQALVGGKNFRYQGFNRALDARRPVGSLVKPVVYLTALSQPDKYNLMTLLDDGPVNIVNPDKSVWRPNNFDRKFHGQVRLYQALVNSYNTSTVRLGMDVGLDRVADTFKKTGYAVQEPLLPSMLLGSLEMSPVQVAGIYHCLASGGFLIPPKSIRAVYTSEGQALSRYPLSIEQSLDPGPVFLVAKTLQAVVDQGSGRALKKWIPRSMGTAGKTGTTNDLRDSWFAGFTGSRLAAVWVGCDDNRPTGLTGAGGALHLFGRIMARLPQAPLVLDTPESVQWAVVDHDRGMRTDKDCPGAVAVPFIKGAAPVDYHPCTQPVKPVPGGDKGAGTGSDKPKPRYLLDWLKEIFK